MAKVQFVTRADDAGSSHSANKAMMNVIRAGFIKNISVMAPGPYVEEAAYLLSEKKGVCFGLHTTLNAEWDAVKWGPVSKLGGDSGLLDENGFFLSDPKYFEETKPPVELIMKEVDAQLEKLHTLGFPVSYIDSHMFPEVFVPGLDDAMKEFAQRKGLIDHMYYYMLPDGMLEFMRNPGNIFKFIRSIPRGQYFLVGHPALYSEEMLQTGNSVAKGEDVAKQRASEAKLYSNRIVKLLLKLNGAEGIRYDQAKKLDRVSIAEFIEKNM